MVRSHRLTMLSDHRGEVVGHMSTTLLPTFFKLSCSNHSHLSILHFFFYLNHTPWRITVDKSGARPIVGESMTTSNNTPTSYTPDSCTLTSAPPRFKLCILLLFIYNTCNVYSCYSRTLQDHMLPWWHTQTHKVRWLGLNSSWPLFVFIIETSWNSLFLNQEFQYVFCI